MIILETAQDRLGFDPISGCLLSFRSQLAPDQEFIVTQADDPTFVLQYLDENRRFRQISSRQAVHEFMRRFLLHVLPAGFVPGAPWARYYGLWHPCQRQKLATCRRQIEQDRPGIGPQSLALFFRPPTDEEQTRCPTCGAGQLVRIGAFEGTRPPSPPLPLS